VRLSRGGQRGLSLIARLHAVCAAVLAVGLLTLCPTAAPCGETDEVIRFYQARVATDPDDPAIYNRLGGAYVQKARESGDVAYYALAEAAFRKVLDLGARGGVAASALASLGVVAIAKHQFAEAIAHAEQAVSAEPGAVAAYAVVGDAYLEVGEYDKAAVAYGKMRSLRGPRYPHARLAYLAFVRGDPKEAIAGMRRASAAARDGNAQREQVAWSRVQLGDMLFEAGGLAEAEAAYREALATFPGYHPAHAGRGRIEAARGRHDEAIAAYQRALGVIPLPQYATALGDVYTRLGRAQEAKRQYELVEYIGRVTALNKAIYNRELALFYADHDMKPAEALALAEKELEIRRDIYTYDVLAWALLKNDRPTDAMDAMRRALRLGTRDARLAFHAGMISLRLGDRAMAKEHLGRALAINPHFHLLHADRARQTLASLDAGRH